jgi:IS5 family transposase
MARQASIVDPSFAMGGRVTRRKAFLDQMDSAVPWVDLVAVVDAKRPKAGHRGRQPWPTEVLLRMLLVQAWFDLSGEATEDALYDSLAAREFVGSGNEVPDATTLLRFRHMAGKEELDSRIEDTVRERLDSRGLLMHGGSCIDATIVEAPSSTKNRSGSRDPEMHQTKKGEPVAPRDEVPCSDGRRHGLHRGRDVHGGERLRRHRGPQSREGGRRGGVCRRRLPRRREEAGGRIRPASPGGGARGCRKALGAARDGSAQGP